MGNTYLAVEGSASNWEEAINLCGKTLLDNGCVKESFPINCVEREKEFPTGLPSEIPVAIPHCRADGIDKSSICFLRLDQPVRFNRMDDDEEYIDTRMVFNLAIRDASGHLEFLQNLMQLVMDEEVLQKCEELPIEEIPDFLKSKLE